jgi:hypothetical protein
MIKIIWMSIKIHLVERNDNMTDDKIYNDPWKKR